MKTLPLLVIVQREIQGIELTLNLLPSLLQQMGLRNLQGLQPV